jgi:inner membrane protein
MAIQLRSSASVTFKALTIGIIVLLLLIPLSMLRGLVSERAGMREQAYARIAEGWGGNLVLGGPILIVPTQRTYSDGEKTHTTRSQLYLLPARLNVELALTLEPEPRKVGIYSVPVYLSDAHLTGEFDFAALEPLLDQPGTVYLWDESRLLLPLSQVRSLREVRRASFNDGALKLGPAGRGILTGVEASVDLSALAQSSEVNGKVSGKASFDFQTVVAGSRDISLLPFGSETEVTLTSNWPHPSFQGAFLPARHRITDEGFSAQWQVLELNRTYRQAWVEGEVDEPMILGSSFGVGIYQTIDVYQRGERAIKYAVLFIALTFLTFFAWEQLSRTRLHPLQYLLVGLALSMFYLLLIALSEHIAFSAAYLIAAVALVALIGAYIAGALDSSARGVAAAGAMALIYGVLYVLVLSEDYALLLGAITLFTALAAVMLVTRRLDWYRLGKETESEYE